MLRYLMRITSILIISLLFLNPVYAGSTIDGKRITAGTTASLFVDASGTVWVLGNADETLPERLCPRTIFNEGKFVYNDIDGSNAFIIRQDGSLWGLGGSHEGQLDIIKPFEYSFNQPTQVLPKILPYIHSLGADTNTIFAIKPDGSLWAWGSNRYGQLGDGTLHYHDTPQQVVFPQ